METTTFTYQYSASKKHEIEAIRQRYEPQKENKMETLRRLDRRAQRAGILPSLILGCVGALMFGVGMCFGLGALAGEDWMTLLFGGLGVALMLPAYPLCRHLSKKAKKGLAPQILRLSDEILNQN